MQLALAVAVIGGAAAWMASAPAPAPKESGASKIEEWPDEYALGPVSAPVQVVEYASLTCPHCAHFDEEVFPKVKKAYIDTGKIRFIARAFPLDPYATSATMVARCLPHDQYFDAMDLIFRTQPQWAFASRDPDVVMNNLADVMKQTGMSRAEFDKCLKDTPRLERISREQLDAEERFNVNGTPTFVVNGEVQTGEMTFEAFQKIVDPLVAAAQSKGAHSTK